MADLMQARRTKYGVFVTVYLIVILAVVGAANWLSSQYNKTVDVTANKQFTLSDETMKVAKNLKSDVNVYYFNKSDSFESARDMLDRYKNLSSKIKINYVDPDKKPDVARVEGARNIGDIIIDNGQKKETAKALTEEELTGALIRASKTGSKTICFVTGSGEHSLTDTEREGYSSAKEAIEKSNYRTQAISLIEKPEVPKACSVLVVGGPKSDYLDPAIDGIRKFVQEGGRVVLNFDPLLNLPQQKMGDTPKLAALATEWGITPKGDVILDLSSASRVFGQLSPVAASYEQHPIVRVMSDIATVFPLARSVEARSPAQKLFSSSQESFGMTNPKLPIKEEDLGKADKGPFALGAAATVGTGASQGRVVVVGSSNWMSNSILAAPIGNRDLMLNVMNWLTSDEDLISIRPKAPEDRRLNVTGNGMRWIFATSLIFLPLIVITSGLLVWWNRR